MTIGTSPEFAEVFSEAVHEQFGSAVAEHILSGRLSPAHLATMAEQADAAAEKAFTAACLECAGLAQPTVKD
jgi:hypothetical protein